MADLKRLERLAERDPDARRELAHALTRRGLARGAILALTLAPPSPETWRRALEHLSAEPPDAHAALIARLDADLARWPNALRLAPRDWIAPLLAGAPLPPLMLACRALALRNVPLTDADATRLAASPHLARLTHLDLSANLIADTGAAQLAASRTLTSLRALDLSQNMIGDVGAAVLATSDLMARLTSLTLTRNRIGPEGAALLRAQAARQPTARIRW